MRNDANSEGTHDVAGFLSNDFIRLGVADGWEGRPVDPDYETAPKEAQVAHEFARQLGALCRAWRVQPYGEDGVPSPLAVALINADRSFKLGLPACVYARYATHRDPALRR